MSRRGRPTPEDVELWRHAMREVAPIRPKPAGETEPETPPAAAKPAPEPPPRRAAQRPSIAVPSPRPATVPLPTTGRVVPGLDQRTADRLRQGRIEIQARIDLHGLRQVEAHHALIGFIDHNHRHGRRLVLVITGKGTFGEDRGVLRTQVPRWLAEAHLRDKVLAVSPARQKDGGDGALYVLLKRRRQP